MPSLMPSSQCPNQLFNCYIGVHEAPPERPFLPPRPVQPSLILGASASVATVAY